ncbi:hypothetical protein EDD90_7379 [Streptomyces sp. Ag109_O5-1]|uniref:hypothetical protein n=1 Tax=Streptomyces sp. Ag109_O5-1 TaxID=1938851 RepID=UPI000F504E19|nr:hypothetical protein [Streptomyces sp. Ag109_O5-1]RPE44149.1 hypothetical protein EDD90_7379 [Streptomyces sp. Ag109_O5-1]
MGYAHYTISRNGEEIEAGYAVETVCEKTGCKEQIDRGLAHLCGATPGGDEYGCGGYFCAEHLLGAPVPEASGQCEPCSKRYDAEHPEDLTAAP